VRNRILIVRNRILIVHNRIFIVRNRIFIVRNRIFIVRNRKNFAIYIKPMAIHDVFWLISRLYKRHTIA
jgi:hypothetical protein